MRSLAERTQPCRKDTFLRISQSGSTVNFARGAAFTPTEVAMRLRSLVEQVEQTPDGRWTLKRRMGLNCDSQA